MIKKTKRPFVKKKAKKKLGKPVGRVILGIDPGVTGGLVILTEGGIVDDYIAMPSTELDLWKWISKKKGVDEVYLEKVWAAPTQGRKQGGSSMFKFGYGYGLVNMAVTAAGLRLHHVTPLTWQKELKIPSKKKEETKPQHKERLRKKAQQLYPNLDVWDRTLGEQRAVCDALLIAEYGRRQL